MYTQQQIVTMVASIHSLITHVNPSCILGRNYVHSAIVMRNGHIFWARACPGMGPSGTGKAGICQFGNFLARALAIGQRALNGHTL